MPFKDSKKFTQSCTHSHIKADQICTRYTATTLFYQDIKCRILNRSQSTFTMSVPLLKQCRKIIFMYMVSLSNEKRWEQTQFLGPKDWIWHNEDGDNSPMITYDGVLSHPINHFLLQSVKSLHYVFYHKW